MKLLFKYLSMHFRCQIEYKSSFILSFVAQLMIFSLGPFLVIILMDKFDFIDKYNIYSVLLSISIVQLGFSIAECFGRGFDKIANLIKKGGLDLLLVRPRNIYIQIIGSNIEFSKLSRIIASFILFIISVCHLEFKSLIISIPVLIGLVISATLIYFSLYIFSASFCFKTIEGLEFMNIFTDGSREFGQYPMNLFGKEVLTFFTYIIPVACVNYYPIMYILGSSDKILYLLSPLYCLIMFFISIIIFNKCILKYESTGS